MITFARDKQFDCVVLDEVELNLHHIFTGSFENDFARVDAFNLLRDVVRNAEYVVCAQAQITELTWDFLKSCERDDIHVVRNDFQRYRSLPLDFFSVKADCVEELCRLVEEGKPVIVPCTSAKFARELELFLRKKFPGKRILEVDSDNVNEPAQKKLLENLNKGVRDWDILIHSPVLEQGVSINTRHFEYVVGFCDAGMGIGAPDSFVQMMFRSRHLKGGAVWCDSRVEYGAVDYRQYLSEEAARYKAATGAVDVVEELDDGRFAFRYDDYVILRAKARAAQAAAKNNTQAEVYAILNSMGCELRVREPESCDEEIKKSLKEAKKDLVSEHHARVANAGKILRSQCREIDKSSKATQDERDQVERFHLEERLVLDLDQLDDQERDAAFRFWNEGKGQKLINALGEAVLSLEHARAVAQYLLENRPQNSEAHGFWTRWIIRSGIFQSLGGRFENGQVEFDGRWFGGSV
ncbi:MAG: plasmid replication protein, CyRepA1 family [Pseudomonadota bacterium]